MRSLSLSLLFSFVVWTTLSAEPPGTSKSARTGQWTVEDVIRTESAGGFQISPDGRWAVWVKTTLDTDKDEHVGQLMRTDLKKCRTIELTRGPHASVNPRWS